MTEKVEFRVEYNEFEDRFDAVRSDDDGLDVLGEHPDYTEAYRQASAAAAHAYAHYGKDVTFPEWDPPAEFSDEDEIDSEDDEIEGPAFEIGLGVTQKALIVDLNGEPWWVDPESQTLKRAVAS